MPLVGSDLPVRPRPQDQLPYPLLPCVTCSNPTLLRCYAAHAICARCSGAHMRETHYDEIAPAMRALR